MDGWVGGWVSGWMDGCFFSLVRLDRSTQKTSNFLLIKVANPIFHSVCATGRYSRLQSHQNDCARNKSERPMGHRPRRDPLNYETVKLSANRCVKIVSPQHV
jgi:hypothetical protein